MRFARLDALGVAQEIVDTQDRVGARDRGWIEAPEPVGPFWRYVADVWQDTPDAVAWRQQQATAAANEAPLSTSRARDARISADVIAALEAEGLRWSTATMRLLVDNINRVAPASRTPREVRFMQIVNAAVAANP